MPVGLQPVQGVHLSCAQNPGPLSWSPSHHGVLLGFELFVVESYGSQCAGESPHGAGCGSGLRSLRRVGSRVRTRGPEVVSLSSQSGQCLPRGGPLHTPPAGARPLPAHGRFGVLGAAAPPRAPRAASRRPVWGLPCRQPGVAPCASCSLTGSGLSAWGECGPHGRCAVRGVPQPQRPPVLRCIGSVTGSHGSRGSGKQQFTASCDVCNSGRG